MKYNKKDQIGDFKSIYTDHLWHMAVEDLKSRPDIAAELAWRDHVILKKDDEILKLKKQIIESVIAKI